MAGSVNKAFILGTLGEDPEVKTTQNGTKIVNLRVTTIDSFEGKDGQQQSRTEWHTVVCFGKQAEAAEGLRKGDPVHVEGKLQTRSWDDQNTGKKQYALEIAAWEVTPVVGESGGQATTGGRGQGGNGGGDQGGGRGQGNQGQGNRQQGRSNQGNQGNDRAGPSSGRRNQDPF